MCIWMMAHRSLSPSYLGSSNSWYLPSLDTHRKALDFPSQKGSVPLLNQFRISVSDLNRNIGEGEGRVRFLILGGIIFLFLIHAESVRR